MPLFKWSDSNVIYLPEIDAEHRSIFLIAAELEKALHSRTTPEKFRAILRNLLAHTEEHFRHEERLMRAVNYPSFEWHKRQHDNVRKQAKGMARRIAGGDTDAPSLLLEFLAGWLRDHTGLTDRMMASYLRNYEREYHRKAS
jgi:hemerythrin